MTIKRPKIDPIKFDDTIIEDDHLPVRLGALLIIIYTLLKKKRMIFFPLIEIEKQEYLATKQNVVQYASF